MQSLAADERYVITGADVVSPLGNDWAETINGLMDGRSGIRPITRCASGDGSTRSAGQVLWCEPLGHARTIGTLLDHVVNRAIRRSGINASTPRTALVIATGRYALPLLPMRTRRQRTDDSHRHYEAHARRLARALHFSGPIYTLNTACASGHDAIGMAMRLLRCGSIDAVICAGADSQITPLAMVELSLLKVLARSGSLPHPRPFDAARDGLVVGEGAAAVVVERLQHARTRHAPIVAEVAGFGAASDATGLTSGHPQSDGAVRALDNALRAARIHPSEVDFIKAHGTGTRKNDSAETLAIKRVFGPDAYRIPVSSTKSMTGHLLVASALVELVFCLMMLECQFVPPTLNLDHPAPDCDLDYVRHQSRRLRVATIVANAFGFGGQNAIVVLRRHEDGA